MIFLQLPSPADTAQALYNTMQQTVTPETAEVTMNAFDLALKGLVNACTSNPVANVNLCTN